MNDPIPGMLNDLAVPGAGLQLVIVVAICLGPPFVWLCLKKAKAMLSASAARRRAVKAYLDAYPGPIPPIDWDRVASQRPADPLPPLTIKLTGPSEPSADAGKK